MLIATFVMAIGLLSLASLVPVGMHEVAVANRAQNAAAVGRSAWRDIKTREWLRPRSAQAPYVLWYDRQGNDASGYGYQPGAFAIDPLFLSINSNDANSGVFPYPSDGTSAPRLPRLTIKLSEYDNAPITSGMYPLAEQMFISHADPMFNPIYTVTNAKTDRPHRVLDTASNQPQFAGQYSWMVTVSPAMGDVGRLFTVSVVVFYNRALQLPVLSGSPVDQQKRETTATVTFPGTGVAIGGGDIQVNWMSAGDGTNAPKLKPNQWLMLYRLNTVTNVTEAAWYRIVAADDYNPVVSPGQRNLTIVGPDWDTTTGATYAALFDSVVGVYSKTLQLE